jgi:hypothetical protein
VSTTAATLSGDVSTTDVSSTIVAAVLGSVTFGIIMSLTMGEVLFTAIPGMYGLEAISRISAVFVGWAIHVSHGTALGLVFGAAVTLVPECGERIKYGLTAGVVYGTALWLALASFVMPIWVGMTTPMNPPVPDWQLWSLLGHILYGAFLGLLIPLYRRYE